MKSTFFHTVVRLVFLFLILSCLSATLPQIIGAAVAMFFVDLIIRLENSETNQMIVTKTYENMGHRHKKFVLPELRIPETDLDETQELPPFRLLPIDALPSQLPPSPSESDYPDPRPTIVPKGPNDLTIGKQTMPETPVAFLAEELELRLTQIKKKDG